MNSLLKMRHLLAAVIVAAAGTSFSFANSTLEEALPAGGDYAVSSIVNGSGTVQLSDSREWEGNIELSVGLESDGSVQINGTVVGGHNPAEASRVEVQCVNGVANVVVRRLACGTVVCTANQVATVAASDTAAAGGNAVTLDVGS